ncbi:leucine-rich repeat-containing protein 70-like [Periplaneta americana]|uniref:leucine-rich repeat-containing protein 70-like n=1 Tax=Periplaneta americana TaxID=6978 RepID=UPI0037E88948
MTEGFLCQVVLFLSLLACTVASCPATCVCGSQQVNCNNATLTSVPKLRKDTVSIDLSFNWINTLRDSDFRHLQRVTQLFVNDNGLVVIEENSLSPFKRLMWLYLHDNNISHLTCKTFRYLKELRYLFLQNNKIGSLDNCLFSQTKKLTKLNLSRNQIKILEATIFRSNPLLLFFDIKSNPLETNWFDLFRKSFNMSEIPSCGEKLSLSEVSSNRGETPNSKYVANSEIQQMIVTNITASVYEANGVTRYLFRKLDNMNLNHYDVFIKTVAYDEYNTFITGKNFNITILTDFPIFCFCKSLSLWFMCQDLEAICSKYMSMLVLTSSLKCNILSGRSGKVLNIQNEDYDYDVEEDSKEIRENNSENDMFTVMCVAVVCVIIISIVLIMVVVYVRKQRNPQHISENPVHFFDPNNLHFKPNNSNELQNQCPTINKTRDELHYRRKNVIEPSHSNTSALESTDNALEIDNFSDNRGTYPSLRQHQSFTSNIESTVPSIGIPSEVEADNQAIHLRHENDGTHAPLLHGQQEN